MRVSQYLKENNGLVERELLYLKKQHPFMASTIEAAMYAVNVVKTASDMEETGMSNKSNGNKFEQGLCDALAEGGFWAHNMANRRNGQPADVIAVKDGEAYLIDCKDCANDTFALSRIEENQHHAMRKWELCGNSVGLFAMNTSEGVYMVRYSTLQVWFFTSGKKSLDLDNIKSTGMPLHRWIGGKRRW